MFILLLIGVAALWLAYGNGANDNFKGVATLYGSDTTTYRGALWWATATTAAGSIVSVFVARQLIATFSGKGLVPDALASSPEFASAVGLGAALTIFIATRIGMPTSTTHALIGGLLGAGLAAAQQINASILLSKFAIPMLISPLLALFVAGAFYLIFSRARKRLGVTDQSCICLADCSWQPVRPALSGSMAVARSGGAEVIIDEAHNCVRRYRGELMGVDAQSSLDTLHYLSAGAVCFSRALNDTPKIAALLFTAAALPAYVGIGVVGLFMAVGGLIQSRRVAETMSKGISELNPGQGFTANLATAGIVLFASKLGVPVSTTHVSCGSIFGIGVMNRSCKWKTISGILVTWITTLPLAAVFSAALYFLIA